MLALRVARQTARIEELRKLLNPHNSHIAPDVKAEARAILLKLDANVYSSEPTINYKPSMVEKALQHLRDKIGQQ